MKHYTVEGSLRDAVEMFESLLSLERSHESSGILQNFNPVIKIVTFSLFIVSALSVNTLIPLLFMAGAIIFLAFITGVQMRIFLYRSTFFIAFFALIISAPILFVTPGSQILRLNGLLFTLSISYEGVLKAMIFTSRVWVCVATLVLITLTTDFMTLIRAFEKMKAPRFFISLTFMTYRYIFLTLNEVYRLLLAKESRSFEVKRSIDLKTLKFLGGLLAALFIKAYERSERVYLAMVARGYTIDGSIGGTSFPFSLSDIALSILMIMLSGTAILLQVLHIGWV